MPSIFDQIKIENTYEMFFPKKEQGLAIIWLYERTKNGHFEKGVFKEEHIRQAFQEVSLKGERQQWEFYNSHIMMLQEFFLFYNEEDQTYSFTDYATYLCEKVYKMLSDRFNPTVIEITCSDLYQKLEIAESENDLFNWLTIHFAKSKTYLKEQIDYLNQQIDRSVSEFSDKAKLKKDSLLTALKDIESKIDEIRLQNQELRQAFREIDKIKTILMSHSVREYNESIDEEATVAIEYFDSIKIMLSMVDSRINKIQPKIQQFFASLNRQRFDANVEKFLLYLLDKTKVISGELKYPRDKEDFFIHYPTSNFTIVEKREELFQIPRNQRTAYVKDLKKEAEAFQTSQQQWTRQMNINIWLDKIKQESQYSTEINLSEKFFEILEKHDNDLQLAVTVIYQSISIYDKHEKWNVLIDNAKIVQSQNNNYEIWDIWMKRK